MDAAKLIQKLLEIEREGQPSFTPGIRSRLLEAQNMAVELYHDRMAILSENVQLRGALQTATALIPNHLDHDRTAIVRGQ
jgi:hypothetical protein